MSQMKPYNDLVENILTNGKDVFNKRTGTVCKTIIGTQLTFDMAEGFPALTLRKLPVKNTIGELIGFFRGYTSAADFRAVGCNFWNKNANETTAWLENPNRKGEDDCGNIYGKQWTAWETTRVSFSDEQDDYLKDNGWSIIGYTPGDNNAIFQKQINQLENLVHKIITDPSDRRLIVSGWNIGEFDLMSLPPCHIQYNFLPMEDDRTMSVIMTIRSMDVFLGTPANIASTAMFLAIVCRLTGYTPDKVIVQGANAHLYENSLEGAKELISRGHFPSPTLKLSDNIQQITSFNDIKGCFERIQPEDISLEGYQAHEAIKVEMVA